ncbi:Mth938-like domain-containing protein [Albirhodobacter sp. R86504]|jgi:uncharacterized protein|uniref:Mth938-like domain-containing protein n=1 Tax=Albirhodobacter sp. R86504 TaxID=3093848 RepID=UPI00366D5AD2
MPLLDTDFGNALPIDGYGPGFFRVGGIVRAGNLIIHSGGSQSWGGYGDTDPLLQFGSDLEVLFLGTGPEISHPPAEFRRRLEAAGVFLELMSTPSAARTYNVLLSEGRGVAAALLAMPGDIPTE